MDSKIAIVMMRKFFEKANVALYAKGEDFELNEEYPNYVLIDNERKSYYLCESNITTDFDESDPEVKSIVNSYIHSVEANPSAVYIVLQLGKIYANWDTNIYTFADANVVGFKHKVAAIISEELEDSFVSILKKMEIKYQSAILKNAFTTFFFDEENSKKISQAYKSIYDTYADADDVKIEMSSIETPAASEETENEDFASALDRAVIDDDAKSKMEDVLPALDEDAEDVQDTEPPAEQTKTEEQEEEKGEKTGTLHKMSRRKKREKKANVARNETSKVARQGSGGITNPENSEQKSEEFKTSKEKEDEEFRRMIEEYRNNVKQEPRKSIKKDQKPSEDPETPDRSTGISAKLKENLQDEKANNGEQYLNLSSNATDSEANDKEGSQFQEDAWQEEEVLLSTNNKLTRAFNVEPDFIASKGFSANLVKIVFFPYLLVSFLSFNKIPTFMKYWFSGLAALFGAYYYVISPFYSKVYAKVGTWSKGVLFKDGNILHSMDISSMSDRLGIFGGSVSYMLDYSLASYNVLIAQTAFLGAAGEKGILQIFIAAGFFVAMVPQFRRFGKTLVLFSLLAYLALPGIISLQSMVYSQGIYKLDKSYSKVANTNLVVSEIRDWVTSIDQSSFENLIENEIFTEEMLNENLKVMGEEVGKFMIMFLFYSLLASLVFPLIALYIILRLSHLIVNNE